METTVTQRELNPVMENAVGWLTRFAETRLNAPDPEGFTLALFGLSCALRFLPPSQHSAESLKATERLVEALTDLYRSRAGDGRVYFRSGGAVTSLMAAVMLHSTSDCAVGYRKVCSTEWSELVCSGRQDISPVIMQAAQHLCYLLTGELPVPPNESTLIASSVSPHTFGTEAIYALAAQVAAFSGFGDVQIQTNDIDSDCLHLALPYWTFYYIKERDLDILCPLLRALKYANLSSCQEYLKGVRFILGRSRDDGGFSAHSMPIHLQALSADVPLDVDREIILRLTVASVWTLLEHSLPGHSVFSMQSRPAAIKARTSLIGATNNQRTQRDNLLHRARKAEEQALAWVSQQLENFNPLLHSDPKRVEYTLKASAELALLCGLVSSGACQAQSIYEQIASYLWFEVFKRDPLQDLLLSNPAHLPAFGFYSSLRQCGYEDPRYRARLVQFLEEGYVVAAERGPATQLDLMYSVKQADLAWPGEARVEVYRRSLLAKHPTIYPLTDLDVYTFTHTIFFLAEFARTKIKCFSDADRKYIARVLPRLLKYYLGRRNCDLSGELLMAMSQVGLDGTLLYEGAWMQLLDAQEKSGAFAGPGLKMPASQVLAPEKEAVLSPTNRDDGSWRLFARDYHTTLVALLGVRTALQA